MRIAAAQFNPLAGDCAGNAGRIAALARDAAAAGARLLVTPQGALAGYPCGDLLLRRAFADAAEAALSALCTASAGLDLHLLVGHPLRASSGHLRCAPDPALYDAASLIHRGRIVGQYFRQVFSGRDPFSGVRYFRAAPTVTATFRIDGTCFGVLIGEDRQDPARTRQVLDEGAQVMLALDATPFGLAPGLPDTGAPASFAAHRSSVAGEAAAADRCGTGPGDGRRVALLVVNPVGAQDEFVFEGCTFARTADGNVAARAPSFEESLLVVDVDSPGDRSFADRPVAPASAGARAEPADAAADSAVARIYGALVAGTRDFVRKNGFPGVLLGLSGGIDSALVLAIAVDALGAQRVRAVMMPSPYTADISREDARAMATRLGVRYEEIPIDGCFDAFRRTLVEQLPERTGTAVENLQARIRGTLLMALSNRTGMLVLTAGNKSESAVGYSTLYGDMAGGLAVIKDVYKTVVWRLAKWRNRHGIVIPQRVIERAPSAELAPGQRDEDSLPPYDTLDAVLVRYLEQDQGVEEMVAAGFARDTVCRVVELVRRAEFKRHQAAPGIRVTQRPFDREWCHFITSGFTVGPKA